jgi:serine/threonine protein phosphatase 1
VALLLEEPLPGFERIHLIGNHEAFLLRFLEDVTVAALWMVNGAAATCLSYGVDPARPPADAVGDAWLQRALEARIPEAHRAFYAALRPSHVEGDYLFVHAGIRPGIPLAAQEEADLLWIREPFLGSAEDFGKVVVHGHTPRDAPVLRANRIGIDTGACYGGALTALVLEGAERHFLQV